MEPLAAPDAYLLNKFPRLAGELRCSYEHNEPFTESIAAFQELAHERAMRISADNEVLRLRKLLAASEQGES